jgi:hypothetical protein
LSLADFFSNTSTTKGFTYHQPSNTHTELWHELVIYVFMHISTCTASNAGHEDQVVVMHCCKVGSLGWALPNQNSDGSSKVA